MDELQSSHRFTVRVLAAVLLLSVLSSGYLILVTHPRLSAYIDITRDARDAREGMLDQETGLRGWVATGDSEFLEPYRTGKKHTESAGAKLVADLERAPDVTDAALASLLAAREWQEWADTAAERRFTDEQRSNGEMRDFLLRGKSLFDSYRAADNRCMAMVIDGREVALRRQSQAMVGVLAAYLLLLGAAGAISLRRRRNLRVAVLDPLDDLLEVINRFRSGDLSARTAPTTVPEFGAIGAALASLADELEQAQTDAVAREQRLARLAHRFEAVVRISREVSGSLSLRYVATSVSVAAADLLGSPTVLWLRNETGTFQAAHRSIDAHGTTPPADLVPPPVVLSVADDALPSTEEGVRAYPSVLAGNVVAVLEVGTSDVEPDAEQVLFALLSTAAAALESARLHSATRELADLDGLTGLPNRRRFETDIDQEWERCRRYGRPLSVAMLDLDHFKRLNDAHGHLVGDEVLRHVAMALSSVLRTSDTAYRYGGEEIVVLLRETGLEDGARAGERLRAAVADVRLPEHPDIRVTTSGGIAERRSTMTHYNELVAAADSALYTAKRSGRDRIETGY
ncbi:MAG TPA: diguanylate cyclase [Nocardioides sp.]|nr:diguanylate cyclase [Nocardioides sp.]